MPKGSKYTIAGQLSNAQLVINNSIIANRVAVRGYPAGELAEG